MIKKTKKNGFTLVELLAVIVILAVVILIAVTAVIPRMNNAKKKALLDEALLYAKMAIEKYAISDEGEGTRCYNIKDLNQTSVQKNSDDYTGAVIISSGSDSGDIDTIVSISNGKYYIFDNGNLDSASILETKPSGFMNSCTGYNPIIAVDANPNTLAYKLIMNEGEDTLEDNLSLIEDRSEAVVFKNPESNPSNSGLYVAEDDEGGSFYYRGAVNNNWVEFAGFYWRVVRINGDGSIRMIYTGTKNSTHTGTNSAAKRIRYSDNTQITALTQDITGLTDSQIATKYYQGAYSLTFTGFMYNLPKSLMSKPDSALDATNNLSMFPTRKNITANKQFYLFKNFNLDEDCSALNESGEPGTCTLKCRKLGDDCTYVKWDEYYADSSIYSTTAAGVYPSTNPTQYVYTSDYKYTCFNESTAVTKENSDGTTSVYVSCQLPMEIVGTVKDQPAQAKVRYHGIFSQSYRDSIINSKDSNAKIELENWYENNIYNKKDGTTESARFFEDYIADEVFCNDRTLLINETDYPFSGDNHFRYAGNMRLTSSLDILVPSLKCADMKNDGFTLNSSFSSTMVAEKNTGNKLLKYPVGLLTADELIMAGVSGSADNNDVYLNTGIYAWLMTPMYFHINYGRAYIAVLSDAGGFGAGNATNSYYLRPVINLKASVLYDSGSGTEADPYKVKLSS